MSADISLEPMLIPLPTSESQLIEFRVISYHSICTSLDNLQKLSQENEYNLLVNLVERWEYFEDRHKKNTVCWMNEWTPPRSADWTYILSCYLSIVLNSTTVFQGKVRVRLLKSFWRVAVCHFFPSQGMFVKVRGILRVMANFSFTHFKHY